MSQSSISETIAVDHASFWEYANNIRSAKDDGEKLRWRNLLTWTIARHALSEELTLYPAMEQHLGTEGVKLSETDKEQHQGVKNYLYELQDMPVSDPKFHPLLDTLQSVLEHHVEHEKEEDMPRLEGLLKKEESQELAKKFERTKGIVPTRSHPAAPTEYYAENLAGLMAAPIDRLQDWLRKWPDEEDKVHAAERREGTAGVAVGA